MTLFELEIRETNGCSRFSRTQVVGRRELFGTGTRKNNGGGNPLTTLPSFMVVSGMRTNGGEGVHAKGFWGGVVKRGAPR